MNPRLALLLCFGFLCVEMVTSASLENTKDEEEPKPEDPQPQEPKSCKVSADCCAEGEAVCNATCVENKCYADRLFQESCQKNQQCRKTIGAICLDTLAQVCGCISGFVKKPSGCLESQVCLVDEDCSYDKSSDRICDTKVMECVPRAEAKEQPKKLGAGPIAGIVIGVLLVVGVVGFFAYKKFSSH